MPDSVKARQIFVAITPERDSIKSKAFADSIKNAIDNNGADFNAMAINIQMIKVLLNRVAI